MRYYIHIALPAKLSKEVSTIEKRYQGNSRSKPHITILHPRKICADTSEKKLIDAVGSAVKKIAPFEIIQAGLGYFDKKKVIFIGIERTRELASCHEAIVRATRKLLQPLDSYYSNMPNPHISLVARLSPLAGDRIWKILKDKSFPGKFLCDKITLLRIEKGNKRWKKVVTFVLGG